MKKPFLRIAVLTMAVILLFGCNLPQNLPQSKPTLTATELLIPTQTDSPTPSGVSVSCNQLTFTLPPTLGDGGDCVSIPESATSTIPMDIFIYPEHTELTIRNYPLTETQFPPQVWVYPLGRFRELLPDLVPLREADLQMLIAGGSWSGGVLPFLPPVPEVQSFYSQLTGLSFISGQGIRFLSEYSEATFPINNKTLFYTFQGLTADDAFWVAVTLPVSSPLLPADHYTLPEGYTSDENFIENYNTYIQDLQIRLDAQTPDSFYPSLDLLDSLVESITIMD